MTTDQPSRVRTLYVPVYDTDAEILDNLPPNSAGQWARQLMLRQLQMEAQMARSFGKTVAGEQLFRKEVRQFIQEEIEPLLAKLDDSMDALISEKLTALKPTLLQSLEDSLLQTLENTPESSGHTEASDSTMKGDNGVPQWRREDRGTSSSSDWR